MIPSTLYFVRNTYLSPIPFLPLGISQESYISLKVMNFSGDVSLEEPCDEEFAGLLLLLLQREKECGFEVDDTSDDGACIC